MQILIDRLRELGVVSHQSVILRSGETSDVYCDMRKSYGHPDVLNMIADEIGKKLPAETTCIAASGYGGLPLGAVVATRFNKKFCAVRSARKDHGTEKLIEGYIPTRDDVIVIVDDIVTSGSSIRETIQALEKIDAHIHSAIVIVKRGEPELSIPYSFLFTLDQIS